LRFLYQKFKTFAGVLWVLRQKPAKIKHKFNRRVF